MSVKRERTESGQDSHYDWNRKAQRFMKTEKIRVSHFDFIAMKEVEIDRVIGDHAYAKVTGYIADDDVEEYRSKLVSDLWVTITANDENGESKVLMTGVIAGFSLERQQHINILTLELMSGTYLMDRTAHFRTFQTAENTYLDAINQINRNYEKAYAFADGSIETTPYHFLMQYQETDWKFVKRIASYLGLPVTPSVVREGAAYYIGYVPHPAYKLTGGTHYTVKKQIDAFMCQASNGEGTLSEKDYMVYTITVKDIFDLWDSISFEHGSGYVYKIHSEYIQEELVHTYELCALKRLNAALIVNEQLAGCSFEAIVQEVKQDKVRVTVLQDENTAQDITKWFPYSTGYSSPDGPAWYCMPEPGDFVRLQLPDEREDNGYIISAVHKETENDRKNPDHKSFKTKYGKELLFTPKTVELTNHQGMSIKIIDGEGIQIRSSKDITIESGGNLNLSSENASLMIAGSQKVDVRQGGAGLHMEEDITFSGGKFRIQ